MYGVAWQSHHFPDDTISRIASKGPQATVMPDVEGMTPLAFSVQQHTIEAVQESRHT